MFTVEASEEGRKLQSEETFASVIRCDSESTPLTFSWLFLHSVGRYAALIEDVTAVIVLHEQGGMLMP